MPKFLIIRFSSIGDIVLTSPVVRCLKQQIPEAQIHFLTKEKFASLVGPNPNIEKVYLLKNKLSDILPQLKEEKYDAIIDLHKNVRSLRVKIALGVKSFSFDKLNAEKWLAVNLKTYNLPPKHIVDRYFEGIKALGIENDGKGLDYFFEQGKDFRPSLLPKEFQESGYIAWAIGGTHFTKRLPVSKIIAAAQTTNKLIVVLGGKEDAENGELIANSCANVFNACGKTTLEESAAIVKQAKLVLTNDTGMMHISAALGKKIVSFWGNTIPEFGMWPYLPINQEPAIILENKNLSCRPCSKLGFGKCPKGHFKCMNDIGDKEIADVINGSQTPTNS